MELSEFPGGSAVIPGFSSSPGDLRRAEQRLVEAAGYKDTLTQVAVLPIRSQRREVVRLTMCAHRGSGDHFHSPWLGN